MAPRMRIRFIRPGVWMWFHENDQRTPEEKRAEVISRAIAERPLKAIGFCLSETYNIEPGGKSFKEYGRGKAIQVWYLHIRSNLRAVVADYPTAYLFNEQGGVEMARNGNLQMLPPEDWAGLMEHLLLGIVQARANGRYDQEDENHYLALDLFTRAGFKTCANCGEMWDPTNPDSGDGETCPRECIPEEVTDVALTQCSDSD